MKLKVLIALWAGTAIFGSYFLGHTPLLLSVWYSLFSLITYVIYAKDKSAAKSKTWRTPENTLHLLSLCGGWLGAVIAQETLRHKTQKTSFLVIFWLTVAINSSAFVALHVPPIDHWLQQTMSATNTAMDKFSRTGHGLSRLTVLFQYR